MSSSRQIAPSPAAHGGAERILTFPEACRLIADQAATLVKQAWVSGKVEQVTLLQARGRILAEAIHADREMPPFPRATRDGFAIKAADIAAASENAPAVLELVGEIRAGAGGPLPSVRTGKAAAIMTGAPAPPGADAIVMVEHTAQRGNQVEVNRPIRPGENIVPAGAEARRGAVLAERGHRVDAVTIALAASAGLPRLRVFARPRVAILPTGDEVVDITATPRSHQIRNSNSYSLAAQVEAAGGEAVQLPIAPDELPRLRELVRQGLTYDLLLLSGGVSVGKYDLVEAALREADAEFLFTGVLIQPGRPVVFGFAGDAGRRSPFLGLPGNPVSTLVTFELFAHALITALSGGAPRPLRFLQARLKSEVKTKPGLTRFLPARLSSEFADTQVELAPWQGSGDLSATVNSDCFLVVPPDRAHIPAGEMVAVLPKIG